MAAPPERRNAPAGSGQGASTNVQRAATDKSQHIAPDLTLQRQAEALHERGPRPVGELLAEILDRLPAEDQAWLRARLTRYNAIDPRTYAAVGARHFPAPPVREVAR